MDEIVKSVDAMSREQLRELVSVLGLQVGDRQTGRQAGRQRGLGRPPEGSDSPARPCCTLSATL
jgi:hypothetical protein